MSYTKLIDFFVNLKNYGKFEIVYFDFYFIIGNSEMSEFSSNTKYK